MPICKVNEMDDIEKEAKLSEEMTCFGSGNTPPFQCMVDNRSSSPGR